MSEENKNNSCLGWGCFIIIFFVIVISFMTFVVSPEKPIEDDNYAQELLARTICQQEVLKNLKNPKSAEFIRNEENTIKLDNMLYEVSSGVYAQNGFGAQIKTYYTCQVKLIDKDSGKIIKLDLK